jgi:DNA-binding transcriptional ArsR family regulator
MVKQNCHPNAYLSNIKNVKRGLIARTKILDVLEKTSGDSKAIGNEAALPYGVVMHHLKLLGKEGIVHRKGIKPCIWTITGVGQKRLVNSH